MGIGAAFATGLIGGLTRNMEREFEKRQTDQQKIDAVQTLVTEYAMKPDDEKSVSGVNAVRAMLTGAQEQVANRPRVGLLGRRSPELDLDIGEMKGIMDELADFEWYVGSGDNKIGWNIKRPDKIDASTARAIFGEVGRHMGSEKTKLSYLADPEAYNTVDNLIHQGISAINMAVLNNPNREENFLFEPATEPWWSAWQEIGGLRAAGAKSLNQTNTDSLRAANPDTNILGVVKAEVIDRDGKKRIAIGPVTFDGTENPGLLEQSYTLIGNKLQAENPESVFDAYASNIQIFDLSPEAQIDFFEDSIALGANTTNILQLAPGKGLYKVIGDQTASRQEKYAGYLETINTYNSTGTFENGVYMLYPHFIERNKPRIRGSFKTIAELGNSQEYVVQIHFGTEVSGGNSFKAMEDERDSNYRVMTGLNNLALKRAEMDEAVAYSSFKDILRFGGEFIGDIGTDLAFLAGVDLTQAQRDSIQIGVDPNRSITSEFLAELNGMLQGAKDRDAKEGGGKDVTYAELMSLRIGLAFQMARAADPSGRLSDQDVRQQLERLMGDFDNTRQALGKIGIVAKEFEQRFKKLNVLTRFGKGDGRRMTPESKAVIDAAVAYDYISRQGQLGDGSNIRVSFNYEELDPNLVTKDGQAVYLRYDDPLSADGMMVDASGNPQYSTLVVDDQGRKKFTLVNIEDLVAAGQEQQRDPTGSSIPSPSDMQGAAAGMKQPPERDPTGSSIPSPSGMQGAAASMRQPTGPRMNPSVDTAGRPVPQNTGPIMDNLGPDTSEFPGLTDEEAEIIRGLRGGPDVGERESVKPTPDRPQRRSRPRPLTDEAQRQILPGEPGSGTEAGAVPKRELPEGALPDITVDTDRRKLEDDELEFTPKADLVLGEGEFSPETHRMVPGTGNNQTGFEIMKRDGSREKEAGKFRLEGGKFISAEVM